MKEIEAARSMHIGQRNIDICKVNVKRHSSQIQALLVAKPFVTYAI